MSSLLSAEDHDRYERDGFALPFPVLEPAEIARYLQAFEQLAPRLAAVGLGTPHAQCHLHFRWAHELATHPVILDTVEALIGPDILIHSTTMFAKEPRNPGFVSWHQDAYNWNLDQPRLVSAWVALTPSMPENGCMRAVAGSHKQRLPHAVHAHPDNLLRSSRLHVELDFNEANAVDFVLQPGEMSLHHANVVHGSNGNTSDLWRIGFAIRYVAADVHQSSPHHEVVLARGQDVHRHYQHLEHAPDDDLERGIAAHAAFWERRFAARRASGGMA